MGGKGPKACAPGTVIDLRGRELRGPLPGGSTDLVICVVGLVLLNGTLLLPGGARVVVAAEGVRLEELRFRGEGPEGSYSSDHPFAKVAGLVVVEGAGRSAVLER